MKISEVKKLKSPFSTTIAFWFMLLFLGSIVSLLTANFDMIFFTSAFAYISISGFVYALFQLKTVTVRYGIYKSHHLKMAKILGVTFIYWVLALLLLAPIVYVTIPSLHFTDSPINVDSYVENILVVVDFASRHANSLEIKELIYNYGKWAIIVPVSVLSSFLLSFISWLYLRSIDNFYYIEYEEQVFQEKKRLEIQKENGNNKAYKWDSGEY